MATNKINYHTNIYKYKYTNITNKLDKLKYEEQINKIKYDAHIIKCHVSFPKFSAIHK